jgi:pimeloyl-ACP methyl ester carboxylesterase
MKRWEFIAAAFGLLLLLTAFPVAFFQEPYIFTSHDDSLATANCVAPYTYFEPTPSDPAFGTAIILHGLSANRKLMDPVAKRIVWTHFRAYSLDMPGHGDSSEPFSFARAEQCAAEFVTELAHRGVLDPARTILIGHSTGAGIAIRLADHFDAAATIAISPAPLTPQPGPFADATPFALPNRLPANLLVFIASLDPYPIRHSAKEWTARAGAPRDSDADFAARRALRLTDVPRSNHTSLLIDSQVAAESADWLQRTLGLKRYTPYLRMPPVAYIVALLGLFLLFPAAASLLLGRAHKDVSFSIASTPTASTASTHAASTTPLLVRNSYLLWLSASILAALLLQLWIPLRPLRLFSGDYLASLLLFVALLAIATYCNQSRKPFFLFLKSQISDLKSASSAGVSLSRSLVASILLAFAFFLAASWLLAWQATDVWLNTARWLRFPALLLPMFLYAFAEEIALGPPRPGRADVFRRLLRALTLRAILLTVMLAAIFLLRSNQILIPLLALYLGIFSIFQRLAADAVRRRAASLLSTVIFSAILAAWYIAAVFPLL